MTSHLNLGCENTVYLSVTVHATIANILEDDIIDCFYNSITDPGIYRDFGRNRPKTVAGLRDMMHDWSE
jgi:hypothetical protein